MLLQKKTEDANQKMLNNKMNMIEKCVVDGKFSQKLLQDIVHKKMTVFKQGIGETICASVLEICALDGIFSAKRKADKLSYIEAKQEQKSKKN